MNKTDRLQVTTPTEREIVMTRVFDAPRALVFDAWTKPELVKRWLWAFDWPLAECEIDLKVGGALRYVWRNADGKDMGMGGVYREITPSERIVHTELFDEDWTGGETLVTTIFEERQGGTMVTTKVLYASLEARDAALKSGMTEGVTECYDKLAALLGSTPAPQRAEGGARG